MLIRPPFLVIVTMFSLFLFLCSSRQGQSCALLLMSIENTHVLDGLTNESNIPRSSDDLIFSKNRRIRQIFRRCHLLLFDFVVALTLAVTSPTLAGQGSRYRNLPVLNFVLVVVLGLNLTPNVV